MRNIVLLLRNFLRLSILSAISFITACSDDPMMDVTQRGARIQFEVSDGQNTGPVITERNRNNVTKSCCPQDISVLTLQGEDLSDTLFLHATVSDYMDMAHIGYGETQTRANPVETTTFYDSFGILAFSYTDSWNESSCLPDYMYNVEVTKASSWTTSYYWPGRGHNIRFFAYAPYNGMGISLSAKTIAGTPTVIYTVPDDVVNQKDLLVAASAEMAGNTSAAVSLTFTHALTAIRFITGDDIIAGHITKITLKGIYGSATYTMGSSIWSDYTTTSDFSQTLSAAVDGSPDQEITPVEATFMMLPQTLPADASIEVVYTDGLTGTEHTLVADIAGSEWPIGKAVVYRISTTSIAIVPTFSVTAPDEFTHEGGSHDYSIASYISVAKPDGSMDSIPMAWSAEFVEDDGAGGYRVIPQPDWLTGFTSVGNSSDTVSHFPAMVTPQQAIISNPHNDILQKASPVSGTYDLSTEGGTTLMNTANCYIINAPGTYSLPLVYGNAIKNGTTNASAYTSTASGDQYTILPTFLNHLNVGITDPYIYNNANCIPDNATLVWQDEENLVTNVALTADGHNLTFYVGTSTIKQGNAIVAVRDADNRIMWSWHIWVTDFVPKLAPTTDKFDPYVTSRDKVITNFANVRYTIMGAPLGWCIENITHYAARSVKVRFTQTQSGKTQIMAIKQKPQTIIPSNTTYYEWGRKDPMLPIVNTAWGVMEFVSGQNKACYSTEYPFKYASGKGSISGAIQNPHTYYVSTMGTRHWSSNSMFLNLWNADNNVTTRNDNTVVKTIYDPSPVGYHMPPPNVFSGCVYDGEWGGADEEVGFGTVYNTPNLSSYECIETGGIEFYCNKMKNKGDYDPVGGTFFLPFTADRNYSNPSIGYTTFRLYYYTAGPLKGTPKYAGQDHGYVHGMGSMLRPDLDFVSITTNMEQIAASGNSVLPVRD